MALILPGNDKTYKKEWDTLEEVLLRLGLRVSWRRNAMKNQNQYEHDIIVKQKYYIDFEI